MSWQPAKDTFARALSALTALSVAAPVALAAGVPAPAQFGPATTFPAGGHAGSIVAADLNRDNRLDIAVAFHGISVLFNLGNGTFAAPTNYPAIGPDSFGRGRGLVVSDLNNDGNLDLATSGGSVLLGDGSGDFPVRTNFTSPSYPDGLAVADFNADGNVDLAIGGYYVLFGRGDGSFGPPSTYVPFRSAQAGDLYGNGKLDIAGLPSGTNDFCVLSNRGDGTFAGPINYHGMTRTNPFGQIMYYQGRCLELGDFSGHGKLDVTILRYDTFYGSNSVAIWTNGGRGNLVPAHEYAVGFSATDIAKGDFNGDGRTDLAIYGSGTVSFLLGGGNGSFVAVPPVLVWTSAYSYGTAVAVADFGGNGTPDLALVNLPSNSVGVMLNQTPPLLQLSPMAGYNQITWPATFGAGFTLQFTTNPSVASAWQRFAYPPVLVGNLKAVADWADEGGKFYRLRKP